MHYKFFTYLLAALLTWSTAYADSHQEHRKLNMSDQKEQIDAFFDAIQSNDLDRVKALVSAGVSPDAMNADGKTALQAMISISSYMSERPQIVNYLIDQRADIHVQGGMNESLLHESTAHNMMETVSKLVDGGIDHTLNSELMPAAFFLATTPQMVQFYIDKKLATYDSRDQEGNTLLHRSVSLKPNLALVKFLLKHINVNVVNNDGETVLHNALDFDYFPEEVEQVVDYLLSQGADINVQDNRGRPVFLVAVRNRRLSLELIDKLVKAGADIHGRDKYGVQAIHFAAANNFSYLKYLVEKGADINSITGKSRETPLLIAIRNLQEQAVTYLLEKGAKPNLQDGEGKTALNYALEGDLSDMVVILREYDAKATDQKEIEKLAQQNEKREVEAKARKKAEVVDLKSAISNKNLQAFKTYYKEALKSDKKKLDTYELATDVMRAGNLDIFQYLAGNGVDIHQLDEGYSMLHDAVFYNNLPIAEFLIESGLDVNLVSPDGRSVFSMTANSSVDMVELLESHGAKIDMKRDGDIVSEAISYQKPAIASYFMGKGFSFDESLLGDEDFLMKLIKTQDTDTFDFLLSQGLDIETQVSIYGDEASLLYVAVMIKADKLVDFLLGKGANPDVRNSDNKPMFVHAINNGDMHILELLYLKGANIDDSYGPWNSTPLYTALDLQRVEIARLLVEKGASINQVSGFEKTTPLHLAAQNGYLELLKTMVQKGGNVHTRNKDGYTPLDIAREFGQKAVTAYLQQL